MLTADFRDGKGGSSPLINEPECQDIANDLIKLILADSGILKTFGPLAAHRNRYDEYGLLIQRLIDGVMSGEKFKKNGGLDFYKKLLDAYRGYKDKQPAWNQAMGMIIELVFLGLMNQKYDGKSKNIYHEHIVSISSCGDSCNTGLKPVDVIMWCNCNKNGEFLEIKKNLQNKIQIVRDGGNRELVEKIKLMYDMLAFLNNNSSPSSIVGMATLAKNPFAIDLIEACLEMSGVIVDGRGIGSLEHKMTVVAADDVIEWYTKAI